jgi:hypothetical protein
MPNWVDEGDGEVPDGKEDALPSRFPAAQEITAAEWNEVMQILQDVRSAARRTGTVLIEDAADVGVVNFDTELDGDDYYVTLGVGYSGTPDPDALIATWNSKQTTGFTINLRAAPGSGEAVSVDWKVWFKS